MTTESSPDPATRELIDGDALRQVMLSPDISDEQKREIVQRLIQARSDLVQEQQKLAVEMLAMQEQISRRVLGSALPRMLITLGLPDLPEDPEAVQDLRDSIAAARQRALDRVIQRALA